MSDPGALVRIVAADVENCLAAKKRRLYEELKGYPTPITACDQQFNYLLEQHSNLLSELGVLEHLAASSELSGESLGSFVESSNCLDPETKDRILSRLQGTQSAK